MPIAFSLLNFKPTDKYSQIYRILLPICNTLSKIKTLTTPALTQYIQSEFGSTDDLYRTILTDFFRHGFDGSGADNFYDAVRGKCPPLTQIHLINIYIGIVHRWAVDKRLELVLVDREEKGMEKSVTFKFAILMWYDVSTSLYSFSRAL